jgi:hypothetical protein
LKATKQVVKVGHGVVAGWHLANQDAVSTYFQLYDALTANVTVGTTTPTLTLWVPASLGVDAWVGTTDDYDSGLFQFSTGLVIAATTTVGGSTDPTNGLLVGMAYV